MWILIHLVALVFFFPALLITIPLHMIHRSSERRNREIRAIHRDMRNDPPAKPWWRNQDDYRRQDR